MHSESWDKIHILKETLLGLDFNTSMKQLVCFLSGLGGEDVIIVMGVKNNNAHGSSSTPTIFQEEWWRDRKTLTVIFGLAAEQDTCLATDMIVDDITGLDDCHCWI